MINYYRPIVLSDSARKRSSFMLFVLGLFCLTQVVLVGVVGISEIPVLLLAPYIFYKDLHSLRAEGFLTILKLTGVIAVSAVISSLWNNNLNGYKIMKVEMQIYSIFAFIVVYHHLLRGNMRGLRWLLLGMFFSLVIKGFAFDPTLTVSETGYLAIKEGVGISSWGGPLFWSTRLVALGRALAGGWYGTIPVTGVALYFIFATGYVAITSISGRSAMATILMGVLLIVLAGRKGKRLAKMAKALPVVIISLAVMGLCLKSAYSYAASNGYMGELAYNKYMNQTKKGKDMLSLLMSGRVEFFVSLRAILDKPIMGYGTMPVDEKGYMGEFIYKYGDADEIAAYTRYLSQMPPGYRDTLVTHSFLTGFWVWYGIPGLIIWLYVLYLMYMYLKKYAPAMPYVYGYLALSIPSGVWDIFFSPYSGRATIPLIITCILFSRAAYLGKYYTTPRDMGFSR